MIINTVQKYDFLANVYVPRIDPTNSQTIYCLAEGNQDVPALIVSNRQAITMYTEKPLELNSEVLNVRNKDNKLVFVEGLNNVASGIEEYSVYIWAVLPVVDIYGTITGYRSTLRRAQPELTNVKTLEDDLVIIGKR